MTREIPLHSRKYPGMVALVDDEDFDRVAPYRWNVHRRGRPTGVAWYVSTSLTNSRGPRVFLHRLILDAPPHLLVDHKDGNGLDCRRCNIRLATSSQNNANRRTGSRISGFKGVCRNTSPTSRARFPWRALIREGGRNTFLGMFANAEDAARAYDDAARRIHGEFALVNFPEVAR